MNEASRLLFQTNDPYEVEYIGTVQDGAFNCDIFLSPNDMVEFNFRVLNDVKDQYEIVFGGNDDTAVDGNSWILLNHVEGFNAPVANYTLAYTSKEFKL